MQIPSTDPDGKTALPTGVIFTPASCPGQVRHVQSRSSPSKGGVRGHDQFLDGTPLATRMQERVNRSAATDPTPSRRPKRPCQYVIEAAERTRALPATQITGLFHHAHYRGIALRGPGKSGRVFFESSYSIAGNGCTVE